MPAPKWVPAEQPYRCLWIYNAPHMPGGWGSRVEVYATMAEAVGAAKVLFKGSTYRVYIDLAEGTDNWCEHGRWTRLGRRDRKMALALTALGQNHTTKGASA